MAYVLKTNIANKKNYGSKRSLSSIKYIVIHMTANDGDSDENNGKYFHNNIVQASAHYFVDSDSVTQSVPDDYVAYSVGGNKYSDCKITGGGTFYNKCNNSNSISIELCDDYKNGKVKATQATIDNTIELTKTLMAKYNISADNVIRHFDRNGKRCPAYWCGNATNNALWLTEFKNKLTTTTTSTPPSSTFSPTITVSAKTYVVQKGDSLSKIGTKTGVAWKTIASINGIKFPYTVKVGQVLKLGETTTTTKPTVPTASGYIYNGIDYSLVFDATYYANKYPDIKTAFGTDTSKMFNHFITCGIKEGRQGIKTFNVNTYKNKYKDLQKAFGNDLVAYVNHYITNGFAEKRSGV